MKNALSAAVLGVVLPVVAVVVLVMWAAGVGVFATAVSARAAKASLPYKVTQATYNPTNRIEAQQWFESAYRDIQGFEANIGIQRKLVASSDSAYNEANLVGIEQECTNAVEGYNANAAAITQAQWLPPELPSSIDPKECT
jgi:hypothetical protein